MDLRTRLYKKVNASIPLLADGGKNVDLPIVTISGVSQRQQAYNDSLALTKGPHEYYLQERKIDKYNKEGKENSDEARLIRDGVNTLPGWLAYKNLQKLNGVKPEPIHGLGNAWGMAPNDPDYPVFKQPVYNPEENQVGKVNPIQPDLTSQSIFDASKMRSIPNGWDQPDNNYPTLKIRYGQDGKPTHLVNSNGDTLPYIGDQAPYSSVTKQFAYPPKQ